MVTMTKNAMPAPMMPHISASDKPDLRAPVSGPSGDPVVVFPGGGERGVVAKTKEGQ